MDRSEPPTSRRPLKKPNRLLKILGACHSERSEESKLLIAKQSEMLRFAQHDSLGTFSAASYTSLKGNMPRMETGAPLVYVQDPSTSRTSNESPLGPTRSARPDSDCE